MIILSRPYLNLKNNLEYILSGLNFKRKNKIDFSKNGSEALIRILKSYNIKSGENIIFPSYICKGLVDDIQSHGYKIIYVEIDKDLNFNTKKLISTIKKEKIKALVLVHYFGFIFHCDSLVKICEDNSIILIEDFSHSFLSSFKDKNFSSKGNALFFSFRKTLPVPNGGLAIINEKKVSLFKTKIIRFNITNLINYSFLRMLEFFLVKFFRINLYGLKFKILKKYFLNLSLKNISNHEKKSIYSYKLGFISFLICNSHKLKLIKKKARKNYKILNQGITNLGLEPFFKKIPKNVLPQWYVLYDKTDKLVDYLNSNGVGASRWPDNELPNYIIKEKKRFNLANIYNKKLALIPMHYDLKEVEIHYIIKLLKKLYI